jgi:hypothetical protein
MNPFKKWTIIVLGTILSVMGTVAAVNLTADPHGVFRDDPSRNLQAPNLSYLKTNRLLKQKDAFDSFLFGSSRVANIDVRHMTGGRWYNLFLAASLPREYLQHLRFLMENGVAVKNVMIGLDDFSFLFDPGDHLSELDLQPHPGVSGKNLQTFYAEYLFKAKKFIPTVRALLSNRSRAKA